MSDTPPDNSRPRPAVLIVIDGFGIAPAGPGNAITQAKMPVFDRLIRNYPAMTLRASGEEVGLSWGEMGNSEVGHLAIGAGRVYYQTFPRINRSIASGEFFENAALRKAIDHVKKNGGTLHLIGMVSAGRVHSMDEHCYALLDLAKRHGISFVAVHAILDGRDTLYNAGIDFVSNLQVKMNELGVGRIASLSGRYFAMDRDHRWDRIQKAYDAIVLGKGEMTDNPVDAIKASYAREVYDEEFVSTVVMTEGKPVAPIQSGDTVIFFNFRPDRMRELTSAFVLPTFDGFQRIIPADLYVVTMTQYEEHLPVEVAFPPEPIDACLAEVLSNAGLKQLHIAETEKYAHVTFFLNGTHEDPFPGEDRAIIPSPSVASYDTVPEMSAQALTDRVVKEIQTGTYDVILMNFANPDMVGHTGNLDATRQACETVDGYLGRIVDATLSKNGLVFITADHGNAEEVLNTRTGGMDKEHSTNPVPFLVIGHQFEGMMAPSGPVPEGDLSLVPPIGMLADVAPTILSLLNIPQPPEMTGQPLL